jgi:hypothetical protein
VFDALDRTCLLSVLYRKKPKVATTAPRRPNEIMDSELCHTAIASRIASAELQDLFGYII